MDTMMRQKILAVFWVLLTPEKLYQIKMVFRVLVAGRWLQPCRKCLEEHLYARLKPPPTIILLSPFYA